MTKIEWTHRPGTKGESWNPIVGCSITSPGCTNCYAMAQAARIERMSGNRPTHYAGTTQPSKAGAVWTGKVALAPEHILTAPMRASKPRTYFVNSMGDVFHEDVPDEWIDRVFAVMALSPQHTFIVLTKRAERMRNYLLRGDDEHGDYFERLADAAVELTLSPCSAYVESVNWPLPNVWLGVSTERQQEADERIPHLLATPAAVRFISAEPLLGPLDLIALNLIGGRRLDVLQSYTSVPLAEPGHWAHEPNELPSLDWVIVGGESGPDARPMHPDWARSLRDQCSAAGVPFFFKQWGEWTPGENVQRQKGSVRVAYNDGPFDGDDWHFGSELMEEVGHVDDEPDLYRVGKDEAGRLLDGREHTEWPCTLAGAEVAA